MPLAVRYVEPKHLWRKALPDGVKSELHAVSVLSIAGLIRQIGSLAKHAESVLGDICEVLGQYNRRTAVLEQRYSRLRRNTLAAMNVEKDSRDGLSVAIATDHFESDHTINQQLLNITTAPEALTEQYQLSESKPKIHLFKGLSADEEHDVSKFYSNPNFFFDHWRAQMELEALKRLSSSGNFDTTAIDTDTKDTKQSKSFAATTSDTSLSATLPTRGKKNQRKNTQTAKGVFRSFRENKEQKRPKLTTETFLPQDHSQSSGYMSEYSSYNSLLDQDGQNHTHYLSHTSISSANGTVTPANGTLHLSQQSIKSTGSEENRPKVLHKAARSSVSSRKESKDISRHKSSPRSISSVEDVDGMTGKKYSLPTHLPSDTDPIATQRRRESASGSLTPITISPGASPQIRRKAETLTNLLSENPSLTTYPEVFSFPEPTEYPPFNRPSRILSSEPFNDQMQGVTLDDFPPQDLSLVQQNAKLPSPSSAILRNNSPRTTPTQSPVIRRQSSVTRPAPPRPNHPPKGGAKVVQVNGGPPQLGNTQEVPQSPIAKTGPPKLRKAPPPPITPKPRRGSTDIISPSQVTLTETTYPDSHSTQATGEATPLQQTTPTNTQVNLFAQQISKEINQTTQLLLRQTSKDEGTSGPKESHNKTAPLNKRDSKEFADVPRRKKTSKDEGQAQLLKRQSSHDANTPAQRKSGQGSSPPQQKRNSRGETGTSSSGRRHSKEKRSSQHGEGTGGEHPLLQKQNSKEKRRSHVESEKKERRKSSHGDEGGKKMKRKTVNSILKDSGVATTITNEHSDLLSSIRQGIKLKKVQQQAKRQQSSNMPWDVAAILERRTALMEHTDNEEEGMVKDHEWDDM